MMTSTNQATLRRLLIFSVAVAAFTLMVNSAAFAQPGGGGCQRGGGGPNGGPQSGMNGSAGYNAQAMGFMPGYPQMNMQNPRMNMQGYAPVAQFQPPTKQELQANYQAKQQRLRDKKAGIRAANVSRQKPKPTKPSPASSPTAANSFGSRFRFTS